MSKTQERGEAILPEEAVVVKMMSRQIPPDWALKERLLLKENVVAIRKFKEI